MILNVLFGAAKTGKTTLLNARKREGCTILCGGDYAYKMATLTGRHDVAQARQDKDDMSLPAYNRCAARGAVINFIENTLILRTYRTRENYVKAFICDQVTLDSVEIWYEAFNDAESKTVIAAFAGSVDFKIWELHRDGIEYGVDAREPSPYPETNHIFADSGKFLYSNGEESCF